MSKELERLRLIKEVKKANLAAWEEQLRRFMPDDADSEATLKQELFFASNAHYKLLRAGNRSGKTSSSCRDLAWKLTRTHPYRAEWNAVHHCKTTKYQALDIFDAYMQTKPKQFWFLGPDYSFVDKTVWNLYLKNMIPSWYYTDDDGNEKITYSQKGYISQITFRNGDTLEFKSYMQRLISLMGRRIDVINIDEMPNDLQIITELFMRLQDSGGEMTLSFTPLVENEEIRKLLDEHGAIETHQWTIYDNPLYISNPDKLARYLQDVAHMPEHERKARLSGEWYYPERTGMVFCGTEPYFVPYFEPPIHWRRIRCVDPSTHKVGYCEMVEDPHTGIWYVWKALEFSWKENVSTAELYKTLADLKPSPTFHYTLSIYDNAESWFGANSNGEWQACLYKQKDILVRNWGDLVGERKVQFIDQVSELLAGQMAVYRKKEDGGYVKKNDHCLDAAMYLGRQLPAPLTEEEKVSYDNDYQRMICEHLNKKQKPDNIKLTRGSRFGGYRRSVR